MAADMQHDGPVPAAIAALASLGMGGRYPQNMERDLHRWAEGFGVQLEPYWIEVPLRRGEEDRPSLKWHPVFLPHEVLAAAYAQGAPFAKHILGQGPGPQSFWEGAAAEPWVQQHPALQREEPANCIPYALHGDDAQFSNNSNLLVLQWSSMLVHTHTWAQKLLFTVVADDQTITEDGRNLTLAVFEKVLAWSAKVLLTGTWPGEDFLGHAWPAGSRQERLAGTRLAGPYVLAFGGTKGDLKWHKVLPCVRRRKT
jgi:hypothetical protein